MKLNDLEIPEILIEGVWRPLCGHSFWDNNHGATLFCRKLGFPSGRIGDRVTLPNEGFRIGNCELGDIWPDCSSGCNDHSIGGTKCSDCRSGSMAGIKIHCYNNDDPGMNNSKMT